MTPIDVITNVLKLLLPKVGIRIIEPQGWCLRNERNKL